MGWALPGGGWRRDCFFLLDENAPDEHTASVIGRGRFTPKVKNNCAEFATGLTDWW